MSDGTLAPEVAPEGTTFDDVPVRRHRRPSGEPPPLPREWDRAGTSWLIILAASAVVWFVTIRALLPPTPPVKIQRWSWRRLLLTVLVALTTAAVVAIVLGNLEGIGLI